MTPSQGTTGTQDAVEEQERENDHVLRAFADHAPKWQRFQTTTGTTMPSASSKVEQNFPFQRQYSHVYHQRLTALKPRCWEAIQRDLGDFSGSTPPPTRVSRILELREDVPSLVVGTLVKECGSPQEDCLWRNKRCRPSDYLALEDESGRVTLDIDKSFGDATTVHQYCTGLVVGVRGIVGANGVMNVEKIYTPAPVAHPVLPNPSVRMERDAHVLLLSGLQLGDNSSSSLTRDMLLSYLDGMLEHHAAAKICRVVIAGGSIAPCSLASKTIGNSGSFHAHHTGGIPSSSAPSTTPQSIQELDAFCAQILAMGIPVDLLPGRDDPTTATWPQRPLHTSLFPFSRTISAAAKAGTNFYQTPNPYAAIWGDKFVIGTDGTNVSDLVQCTNYVNDHENMIIEGIQSNDEPMVTTGQGNGLDEGANGNGKAELDALEKTLAWGHICPTGPDSVPTMPHTESDPLVLREFPHIYFMGNASCFASQVKRHQLQNQGESTDTSTRLICVPKFGATGQAVRVCLKTLDVQLLRFVAPNKS